MYRVNAQRSQEKNDRTDLIKRNTKVTCARDKKKKRARNDESRELFAESRVHFAKDEC